MNTLTANDLKIRGISAVEASLEHEEEVIISVRGQDKYVVMDIAKYSKLRELELELAVQEARADYHAGRFVTETPAEHVKRLRNEL
jgi:prevent-host-death family protein